MKTYTFSYQDKDNNVIQEVKVDAINRADAFRIRNFTLANSMINDLQKN